jgi:hypothetical protein
VYSLFPYEELIYYEKYSVTSLEETLQMQPKTWDLETQTWLVSSSSKQIVSNETSKTLEKLITSHTGNMIH